MTAFPAPAGQVDSKIARAVERVVGLASSSLAGVQHRVRELTEVENATYDSGEFAEKVSVTRGALLVICDDVREVVRILHGTDDLLDHSRHPFGMQQPLRTASATTAGSSLHAAVHVLAPLTVGTSNPETLSGDAAAAAVSMVWRFLHAALEALGCLVLHLERGLSLYGQQEYELSAGGDRRDLCSVAPLTLVTVL